MFYTTLTKMPYAQARVAIFNSSAENPSNMLVSYTIPVARIKDGYLIVMSLYSQTTRKHISAYVQEFAKTDYTIAKRCYTDNLAYNIKEKFFVSRTTGEVIY